MTVIAWDGTTLAADRQSSINGLMSPTTKIWRVAGVLCGGAGALALCVTMRNWTEAGRKASEFPVSRTDPTGDNSWVNWIVIETNGSLTAYAGEPEGFTLEGPYAFGTGGAAARAAMYLGFDAARAVEAANAVLTDCGMGVDVLSLNNEPVRRPVPDASNHYF